MKSRYNIGNKRGEDGTVLEYLAVTLAREMAIQCTKVIKNHYAYSLIAKNIDSSLIDFYYKVYFCKKLNPLARKIVMDLALQRMASIEMDGAIICLDADCTVKPNYLLSLENHFFNAECDIATIYYEHQEDAAHPDIKQGIIAYGSVCIYDENTKELNDSSSEFILIDVFSILSI